MLIALVTTVFIEGLVMYFLTKSKEWVKYNLYCNLVTNPLLNFALMGIKYLFGNIGNPIAKVMVTYYIPVIILEAIVFFVEGLLYSLMADATKKQCFRLSIITNAVSAAAGIIYSFFYYF